MKELVNWLAVAMGILVTLIFGLAVVSSAHAQQRQMTPEQQEFIDLSNALVMQRNDALNQVAQFKALTDKLQRELEAAKKAAAACIPK